jgi:hypothetical protein
MFEQFQGGHVYPAVLGGPPLPWNYITQMREDELEWLSAHLEILRIKLLYIKLIISILGEKDNGCKF